MKIKLLSDLHREFDRGNVHPYFVTPNIDTDVLILAGDIGKGYKQVNEVIALFRDAGYNKIMYLPGNHEYYGSSINEVNRDLYNHVTEAYILNPGFVKIGDVTFIGATLWTNFRNDSFNASICKSRINDFNTIRYFSPAKATELFDEHFDFIKTAYEAIPGKKVIVTHFLPAIECIHPKYAGPDVINTYFANDLSGWIGNLTNTTWCFGHTHDSVDMMIGETRMLCNPFGYAYHETNNKFDPNFNFEV